MIPRTAFRPWLASTAILFASSLTSAQPPLPPKVSSGAVNAQIIPVNLTNEQVAATVNGDKVLIGEVRKTLDQRPSPFALTEEQKKQSRQAALDALIEDVLMRQYLTKEVPQVNRAEYDKELQDFQKALEKKGQPLKLFLDENGLTEEQMRRDIVARLQWKALLQRYYPDDRLKPYYDANKPYFDKILVRASHILIKLPANATKEQRDQAMQQMLVWRQEILTGKAKFEDIAKQHSQCPSKTKGGDIGPFPYKFVVVPEFARTAFSMKIGDLSDVVHSAFGLHLIKVTERTPGEASQLETLRDLVREVWAQDDELYLRVLADFRKKSDIKIVMP